MIVVAELTADPVLEADGLRHVEVTAQGVNNAATGAVAVLIPPAPGLHVPLRRGDRVLLAVPYGSVAAGAYVLLVYGPTAAPLAAGNLELRSRGGADVVVSSGGGGGEVKLGDHEAETWQRPMLFDRLSAEVVSLKAQVDVLAHLLTSSAGLPPMGPLAPLAPAVVNVALATILGGITGGDPGAGVGVAKG